MLGIIFIIGALILGSIMFASHMDKIRIQAWEDKKHVIARWATYFRVYNAHYHGTGNVIVCYDEVEEARRELMNCAEWYNKKYKKYGYCAPPELLLFEEEEFYGSC